MPPFSAGFKGTRCGIESRRLSLGPIPCKGGEAWPGYDYAPQLREDADVQKLTDLDVAVGASGWSNANQKQMERLVEAQGGTTGSDAEEDDDEEEEGGEAEAPGQEAAAANEEEAESSEQAVAIASQSEAVFFF